MKTLDIKALLGITDVDSYITKYRKNSEKVSGGDWPCALCGKAVDPDKTSAWVHLVDGGINLGHVTGQDFEESADLGWYPVGSDCAKKVPKDYKVSSRID